MGFQTRGVTFVATDIDIVLWNVYDNDFRHYLDIYILYAMYVLTDWSALHVVYVMMVVYISPSVEWHANVPMNNSPSITTKLRFSYSP